MPTDSPWNPQLVRSDVELETNQTVPGENSLMDLDGHYSAARIPPVSTRARVQPA